MLLGDFAYGFCLWEMGHLSVGLNPQLPDHYFYVKAYAEENKHSPSWGGQTPYLGEAHF